MKTNAKRWTRRLLFMIGMSMPIALCLLLFFNSPQRDHNALGPDSAAFAPLTEPNATLFPAGTASTKVAPEGLEQQDIRGFTAPMSKVPPSTPSSSNENIAFTERGAFSEMNASQIPLAAVPEPSSTLLMLGSGAMLLMRRRRLSAR